MLMIPAPPDKTEMKRVTLTQDGWLVIYRGRANGYVNTISISNNSDQTIYVAYKEEKTETKYDEIPPSGSFVIEAPVKYVYAKRSGSSSPILAIHEDWYSEPYIEMVRREFVEAIAEGVQLGLDRHYRERPVTTILKESTPPTISKQISEEPGQTRTTAGMLARIRDAIRGR